MWGGGRLEAPDPIVLHISLPKGGGLPLPLSQSPGPTELRGQEGSQPLRLISQSIKRVSGKGSAARPLSLSLCRMTSCFLSMTGAPSPGIMGGQQALALLITGPRGKGRIGDRLPAAWGHKNRQGLQRGNELRHHVCGAALLHSSLPLGFQRTWTERAD